MSEFKLSIKSDVKDLTAHLNRLQRREIRFASALAITRTAQDVRTDLYQNMLNVFDRPTKYVVPTNIVDPKKKGSLYLIPAEKDNLEAEVYIKNLRLGQAPAWDYLQPQVEGGARKPKGSEQSLRGTGVIGGGQFISPSTQSPYGHVRLNKYGNVSAGQMQKILSGLHSLRGLPRGAQSRQKSRYFAMPKKGGRTATGIWERDGKKLKKLFNVTSQPYYRKRFRFYQVAEASAMKHFRRNFQKSLNQALATAR